jgi:hypothetical protein
MAGRREKVALGNLGRGAALELFDREFNRALANIVDPNTKAEGVREITLRVKISPDENREAADVEVECKSKLCGNKPFKTQMFVGKASGAGVVAFESNPKQIDFTEAAEPLGAVAGGKAAAR